MANGTSPETLIQQVANSELRDTDIIWKQRRTGSSVARDEYITGAELKAHFVVAATYAAFIATAVLLSGNQTVAGVKTFTSNPIIPDEAYGVEWSGSLKPPTKNAIYNKIETLSVAPIEDTFTPAIVDASGNPTEATHSIQVGHFSKIGRLIFFSLYVAITAKNTLTTTIRIQGLPTTYPPADIVANAYASVTVGKVSNLDTVSGPLSAHIAQNTSYIQLEIGTGGGTTALSPSDILDSFSIMVSGFYITA